MDFTGADGDKLSMSIAVCRDLFTAGASVELAKK